MDTNIIKKWELIIGIIFISILGSFFHFTYELSGYNIVIGSFSAVNESVWEHLKLVFFPLLIFSAIEYMKIKKEANNFLLGKAIASYVMPAVIVIIFYSYEMATGSHSFAIDMLSYFVSIIVGQFISYKILCSEKKGKGIQIISLIAIIILALIFVIFTFIPPEIFIFEDSTTGQYGIN